MDSSVALALMRKAQLVFETDETFLCFPLVPLVYEREDFSFMSADLTNERLVAWREFSGYVDQIPRGPTASTDGEDRLSDVYNDVLLEARLATSTRTMEEENEYQEAIRYLYVMDADGLRKDSIQLTTYKQYRDLWVTEQEDYNSKNIDAQYSTDPAEKATWEVKEPIIRQGLADIERDWNAKGLKVEVERARQTEERLGSKSPALIWAEWRKRFNPDLDRITDPTSNQSFFPSGFSPSNAFEEGEWSRFMLQGAAIDALAREAPNDLRGRLKDQADLEVDRLSFECTSLRVERPWFVPQLFLARFWRFVDESRVLSDGDGPLAGACPAYVAGLVLARSLVVKLRDKSSRNNERLANLQGRQGLAIGSLGVRVAERRVLGGTVLRSRASAHSTPFNPGRGGTVVAVLPKRTVQPRIAKLAQDRRSRLARIGFSSSLRIKAKPRITEARPTSSSTTVDDQVHILALICKRIPRCPNPDSSLSW